MVNRLLIQQAGYGNLVLLKSRMVLLDYSEKIDTMLYLCKTYLVLMVIPLERQFAGGVPIDFYGK
jgi:hypothetical protein